MPLASAAHSFDVAIIGGGQTAPPLSRALAKQGRRVALAERRFLGGSCVNFGCTPTKAAIASARVIHQARRASEFGIHIPNARVDFPAVLARARRIAEASRAKLDDLFDSDDNGTTLLRGHARFVGRDRRDFLIDVAGTIIRARHVVLDTGTRSRLPSIPGLDAANVLHAGNWLDRPELPEHLVVLGGGYIAVEMAQFYCRMGSMVTIVERSATLLSHEDPDVTAAMRTMLEDEGIRIRLDATIDAVEVREDGIHTTIAAAGQTDQLVASHLFVATGRKPNTDDLGLDVVEVDLDERGFVVVDDRLATSVPGIWASGDVRGGPMFTHTAWDDYRIIESQLAGDGSRTTDRIVPYAVFTDPELGRVGLTEREAQARAIDYRVAHFDLARNGRATEAGETRGFIRVLVDDTDLLIGAAVFAPGGAELVHLYVDLMNAGVPYTAIRDAVHIHPTLAEAVQSAVARLDR